MNQLAKLFFAALIVLTIPTLSFAQAPSMPMTPTTKILAVGTIAPGTDLVKARAILPTEVQETVNLYLDGKIDQWFSLEDRTGVVFILNMTDVDEARAMLEKLPLGQAHYMTFELTRIGPLNPLRALSGMQAVKQ